MIFQPFPKQASIFQITFILLPSDTFSLGQYKCCCLVKSKNRLVSIVLQTRNLNAIFFLLQLSDKIKDTFPLLEKDREENVVPNPMDLEKHEDREQEEVKKYGPKSVLKPGVLGNYEPDYKIGNGPGMYLFCYQTETLVSG